MIDMRIYSEYICYMATTFHIPDDLLKAVDERAKEQKLSRNRFVILALKNALESEDSWSPRFLEALDEVDDSVAETVDDMLDAIERHRSTKKPISL